MKNLDWNDLHIFAQVARAGGLSGAARALDLSPATVGRRMLALEAATGSPLFVRAQTGYSLTPQGSALHTRVRAMEAAAAPISDLFSDAPRATVRLSAGTGTAMFLADRFSALSRPDDAFRLVFATTEALLDIAHREADLAIRNQPATSGNLASRRLARLRFAPYRSFAAGDAPLPWVAMDESAARHPAARWVHAQNLPIRAMAGSVATLHQLIRAGAGIGIMPCMIADTDPSLTRAGPPIEDLTEHQYLVMHNDDRHRPPLRRLAGRLTQLYQDAADLLAGDRPLRAIMAPPSE